MNGVARTTIAALAAHGVPALPSYQAALARACNAFPPPFGTKQYRALYQRCARDPQWLALTLANAARGEGEGAEHLWDLAACTQDLSIANQVKQHAIDEARHSRAYVTLLELIFPNAVDARLRPHFLKLSPGYTKDTPLKAEPGSAYAHPISLDELVQMNIAEIRTRANHLLQGPILLAYCTGGPQRGRVQRIVDSLLFDETKHVAYTARLIEQGALKHGQTYVADLMRERVREFNQITDDELAGRTLRAA
jgi:hypothetical protein